ncbi:FUSC family protein [Dokdonella sp.]|uniref:FUSC family protein n=1 Tax=Dokdonella sp. TaxID=2291710 RepID=UPI0039C88C16
MLRSLIEIKPRDVPVRVALRNAAAVVLPLAAGIASHHVEAGLGVAAGALNTMFTDQPGPYRLRMQRMLLTAFAAGLSAFAGSLIGPHTALLAIASLVWGVGGGLLVALGPDAARAGLTSMILLVITAAQPRSLDGALAAGGLIVAGGVLQTLFAIAAWPLQRYRPERHALAEICRQLAASARRVPDRAQAPPVTQALLDVERMLHGAHRARGEVMQTFRVLAELVERIRLELLALVDLRLDLADHDASSTLGRALEYAARTLEALAVALDRGTTPLAAAAAMEGLEATLDALAQLRDRATQPPRELVIALARAQGLAGQLRAMLRNANFAGSRGDLRAQIAEAQLPRALRPRSWIATLRANVGLSSVAFRHALRCGVCLSLAVAAERLAGLEHGYWIPMTIAIVLKPDFAGTLQFGLLRVAGTLLGLVLTTALVHYAFAGPWEELVLLGALCVGFRMLVTVHYGLGVMMLTGVVVILLAFGGIAPGETMVARGIATAIGSAVALFAYAAWPTWERRRVRPALATMLDAYRGYFATLLQDDVAAHVATRTHARSARTNAEASIARLRGEPRPDRRLIAFVDGLFANANRFVRACMSFEAVLQDARDLPERDALAAFAAQVDGRLEALTNAVRDEEAGLAIADLRSEERAFAARLEAAVGERDAVVAAEVVEAFDRMTDSVDTLAHLVLQAGRDPRPLT